jgi:RNA polymerase sigma factor (TIGR02999 family)
VAQIPPESVSELLVRWRAGDKEALRTLVPLVYRELHAVAHRYLKRERPDHTLQTTDLVHEVYLRLMDQRPFEAENRAHFVGIAARLMRQVLVDNARSHRAAKRGANLKIDFDETRVMPQKKSGYLVDLDDALTELAELDERQSRIVELKFFGGLTIEEIAELLQISPSTAKRDWNVAKAWLSRQIERNSRG